MPQSAKPFFQKDFSSGMVTNVNENILPASSVSIGLNYDFDVEIGSAVSRLGREIVGAQLVDNMSILGLHQHIDHTNSSNNKLFATINAAGGATSVIYDVLAGTTSQTGLTANKKMRYLTFNGSTLAINGSDAERSYTPGGGWITTGGVFDLADYPGSNSCELAIEYLDRVYTAGDSTYPTRLHFSGVLTAGVIAWAGDFIDIEPEDGGGAITALAKVPGYLLIFKERSLKRFNGSSAFPESLVQIGTPSQESVIMAGGLCAFYSNSNENSKGFYITDGKRPIPISHDSRRPIKKFVDAISSANEANIAGWATDRYFAWSVGDLTVDGETYTNVVFKYNRYLSQWSIRTYPSEFKVFANYIVSGVNTTVGGDDDGTIYRLDKAAKYSDDSTAIPLKLRTNHNHFGYNQIKSVSDKVIVRGEHLEGMTTSIIPNRHIDNAVSLGADDKRNSLISSTNVNKNISGNTLAIELSTQSTNASVIVREIELPSVSVDLSYL